MSLLIVGKDGRDGSAGAAGADSAGGSNYLKQESLSRGAAPSGASMSDMMGLGGVRRGGTDGVVMAEVAGR